MQDHNTTESSCQDLEGALCSTHARVQQRAESKVAGRRLVSKSDVKGESCLPRSCIQEPGWGWGWLGKGPIFFEEVVMVLGGDEKTVSSYGWKIGQGIGLIRPST